MLEELIHKHARRGIFLDTNVFLLHVIGTLDRDLIARFKRTQTYTREDFDLLRTLLSFFDRQITTPHVLAEVSNLMDGIKGEHRNRAVTVMAEQFVGCDERYEPVALLTAGVAFQRFGLTDAAVVETAAGDHLVLTDDLPLYVHLSAAGRDVINFTHLRRF